MQLSGKAYRMLSNGGYMNIERMLELADILENDKPVLFQDLPVRFRMEVWDEDLRQCGTACCIGGFAEILWGSGPISNEFNPKGAATLLGLSREQANNLFYGGFGKWWNCSLQDVTPKIAAAGIRRMVAEESANERLGQ